MQNVKKNLAVGEALDLDYPSIVDRIREAVGGGSDQAVAAELGVSRQTVLNMKKGEGLSLPKLAQIARDYKRSPLWLIFGFETDRVIPVGRAIEATDTEVISKFTLDELSAVGELSQSSGMNPASVIHALAREALTARGRIRQPPEIPVAHLELENTDEDDLVRTVVKGEILAGGVAKIFPNVRTVRTPKQFRPGEEKDDWAHPNTFHGYFIRTDEFAHEGLLNGDLILCAAAYYYTMIEDGQPVLIPLEDKVAFARFYRDIFSSRFIFRPIKDLRPILKFPGVKFADLFTIQGIIRPASP